MENLIKRYITYKHSYHLVDPSPWPIFTSFSALVLTGGSILYMHSYKNGGLLMILGFLLVLFSITCWWRDVIREATYEGHHTKLVQLGLLIYYFWNTIFCSFLLSVFSFKLITNYRNWNNMASLWNWGFKSMAHSIIKYFDFTFIRM